jgi:hypothetical protein
MIGTGGLLIVGDDAKESSTCMPCRRASACIGGMEAPWSWSHRCWSYWCGVGSSYEAWVLFCDLKNLPKREMAINFMKPSFGPCCFLINMKLAYQLLVWPNNKDSKNHSLWHPSTKVIFSRTQLNTRSPKQTSENVTEK